MRQLFFSEAGVHTVDASGRDYSPDELSLVHLKSITRCLGVACV
jgi:hypothetical protein